jgi:hypothetical protein
MRRIALPTPPRSTRSSGPVSVGPEEREELERAFTRAIRRARLNRRRGRRDPDVPFTRRATSPSNPGLPRNF